MVQRIFHLDMNAPNASVKVLENRNLTGDTPLAPNTRDLPKSSKHVQPGRYEQD